MELPHDSAVYAQALRKEYEACDNKGDYIADGLERISKIIRSLQSRLENLRDLPSKEALAKMKDGLPILFSLSTIGILTTLGEFCLESPKLASKYSTGVLAAHQQMLAVVPNTIGAVPARLALLRGICRFITTPHRGKQHTVICPGAWMATVEGIVTVAQQKPATRRGRKGIADLSPMLEAPPLVFCQMRYLRGAMLEHLYLLTRMLGVASHVVGFPELVEQPLKVMMAGVSEQPLESLCRPLVAAVSAQSEWVRSRRESSLLAPGDRVGIARFEEELWRDTGRPFCRFDKEMQARWKSTDREIITME
eukprot:gnl/Dysnectes_brevis/969_a1079_2215.p1 GENE.gnl/Dysnectes_brevis/969_a1079_2215~~gnl/Dysnectes_brevis/969_a1079_2215.p1  ORF type:complete len:308 (-),score=78.76 gnl/Dysnectes_brevis/969_a1079_2215:45-968(-)